MVAPDIDDPVCFIHQIVPRSLHDLVAKLRQETARADVLGEGGNPIIVIGVVFDLARRDAGLAAGSAVRFLVEGQGEALWRPSELFDRIKGTPAEAVLFQTLRMVADGVTPLVGWMPPDALGLGAAGQVDMTVLGSLSVLVHALPAGEGQPEGARCAVCLQEGRSEMEALELPLRAASDFRRFHALTPRFRQAGVELDFSGLEPVARDEG
ncbi:hypothetical protein [Paragemmobacter straminiformis]|uniref:Uncharacterized protein n=1 Tax=Paragemmobacter straminiformis TaxID=2045119 RepID=A0A842I646_9RHOB|nr:hypothetical protein [Gemmobacter straminiformis]MBC2835085.1 hypothetical protein [Gemmobacter straminiformis]